MKYADIQQTIGAYLSYYMDGTVFEVRENSNVVNETIYIVVGVNRDGKKEVLSCG
ncbi:transposase [Dyadobacter sp. 22481]|uniref:transposase n=1 Tax=Dyadobacter sp. 22481 TaxID=3453926 RepID=UPI003F83003E